MFNNFELSLFKYSGDLKSELVRCSDHGDFFACWMVCYSEPQYQGSTQITIWLTDRYSDTIWIPVRYLDAQYHGTGHLNSKPFE